MSHTPSYLSKTFIIADADARLRDPQDLTTYLRFSAGDPLPPGVKVGDFKTVPRGTVLRIDEIRRLPTGSQSVTVFCHAVSDADGAEIGWTSTRNLAGRFVNETLGLLAPAPGSGKFGPNAAWSHGIYLGQIDLVEIVSASLGIRRIAERTAGPFLALVAAAAAEAVTVAIESGFRSYPEQKFLHDGYVKHLPGFNKAAPPGASNHQNGIAFDIAVSGGAGNPAYDWLTAHATGFGFVRTVSGEPWHWEYDPSRAAAAQQQGTFKTPNVND